MNAPIRYAIVPARPEAHLFRVACTVADPDPAGQEFALPAWIPGQLPDPRVRAARRFDPRREPRSAGGAGKARTSTPGAPRRSPGPLTVSCEVYAWDLSVRGAHLDTTHGFFNGTCVFLRVLGPRGASAARSRSCRPRGARYRDWRVATAMPRNGAQAVRLRHLRGGELRRADRSSGRDGRIHAGELPRLRRAARHRHHRPPSRRHARGCARDLKRAVRAPDPVSSASPRRWIATCSWSRALGEGYGGLEHRASTALLCSRDDLPRPATTSASERYRTFLGLAATSTSTPGT